jgi:acyl carrier protein
VYDQIKEILITSFQAKADDVAPTATLTELGLDSLDLVELAMAMEPLGVRVTDDELAELQRIDAIVRFVEARAARAA